MKKQLMERHEAIEHIKHFGEHDPNYLIYEEYTRNGFPEKARRFLEYRKTWEAVRKGERHCDFPLHVTFGLSDSCNLSCPHCYRVYNRETSSKRHLEKSEIYGVIDQCRENGVFSIGLGTESELFTYKGADEIIRYVSSKEFDDFWIYTNGHFLNDHNISLILESNVTRLLVSLDAISEETYKKVRGKGFYRVMSNIFNFLEKRNRKPLQLPVLRVSFVKYNLNEHEADDFIAFWKKIASEVDIQSLIDIKNIDELKYDHIDNPRCNYPENMLYIKWNGEYKPCCSEFCKHLTIGNVAQMSLKDAWNSDLMKSLRSQFRGDLPLNKICVNCLSSLQSKAIYQPIQ